MQQLTVRPVCRKCGGPLQGQRVPVLENSATAQIISCILCGDIYKERIYCAPGQRPLSIKPTSQPLGRVGCLVAGCANRHHAKGLCEVHYRAEFNRRALRLKAKYDAAHAL